MIVRKYFQPDAPDPVLDAEFVLSLARRHVPGARRMTGIDESGGEARVYFIDQDVIVKTQRPQRLRTWTSLEKEAFFLDQIDRQAPDLSVPRVLGYGREGTTEYTCMTRMPGDAAVRAGVPDDARPDTLRALGRVIRRIHALDQEPFRTSGLFPEEYTAEDLRTSLAEGVLGFAKSLRDKGYPWPVDLAPEAFAARLAERVPVEEMPTALHTNPGPTHTFVDPSDGRFLALIDFGDAYIGHPVFDLWQWGDPVDRDHVIAGYLEAGPVGEAFDRMLAVGEARADLIAIVRGRPYSGRALEHLRSRVARW